MTLTIRVKLKAGQGNFGHAGRPGKIGGSAAASYKSPKMPPWKYSGTAGDSMRRSNERVKIMEQMFPGVKFSTQPPNSLALKLSPDWPGKGEPHAIFDMKNVRPSSEHIQTVKDAIVRWGPVVGGSTEPGWSGYTNYNAIKISTGLDYAQVFSAVKALYAQDPYSIRFSVDRLGKSTYVQVRI